jgi:transposase-like protein
MEGSRAVEGTKEMLLSMFSDDELEVCPRCQQKHVRHGVHRAGECASVAACFR